MFPPSAAMTASETTAFLDQEVLGHFSPGIINGADEGLQSHVVTSAGPALEDAQQPVVRGVRVRR